MSLNEPNISFDQANLKALREGQIQAWGGFVEEFAPRIFRYFRNTVFDERAVEDLVSETLQAIWTQIPNFREESSLSTWVFKICRNKLYDQRKGFQRLKDLLQRYTSIQEVFSRSSLDPESLFLLKDDLERIAQAMRLLPLHFREALTLRYIQELSISEVANIMEVDEYAIKNYTRDGKALLRRRVEEMRAKGQFFGVTSPLQTSGKDDPPRTPQTSVDTGSHSPPTEL